MEKSLDYTQAYADAMAACGADMLSTGDSPAGLLGRERYVSVALPMEKRLFERLNSSTDKFLSLHICGDTTAIVADMAESGAHVLEIDHEVRLEDAFHEVGDTVTLWGNLDPVKVLLQSNRQEVAAAATRILSTVHAAGRRRFVLSSGCILAPGTPSENIHALIDSARRF
jgi:uroporphyrinogen-III decarboxylase